MWAFTFHAPATVQPSNPVRAGQQNGLWAVRTANVSDHLHGRLQSIARPPPSPTSRSFLAWLHAPQPPSPPLMPPDAPPPQRPPPPGGPPPHPVADFDVQGHAIESDAFWNGWSREGGDYPWLRAIETLHGKSNRMTGPRRGPGFHGEGAYWYAGGSGEGQRLLWSKGKTYILAYTGDLCHEYGAIGWVNFSWHMFRHDEANTKYKLGTLRLRAEKREVWSRTGDYGDVWHRGEQVRISADSFAFEYMTEDGYGEPALAEISVECDFAPPPRPPQTPPSRPKPLPPPIPSAPPVPLRPAQAAVSLDGLWIAILLACCLAYMCYHDKEIFEVETPRTMNRKMPGIMQL